MQVDTPRSTKNTNNRVTAFQKPSVNIRYPAIPRFFCAILILLNACTTQDYFRKQVTDIPCEVSRLHPCKLSNLVANPSAAYTLGFVEIDDQGQFYDKGQADALLKFLKNQSKPLYVTIYVHGWHHNADDNDINVKRFQDSLMETKLRNPTL